MSNCDVGEMYGNEEGSRRCHIIVGQEESRVTDLTITVLCPLDQNHGFGSHR